MFLELEILKITGLDISASAALISFNFTKLEQPNNLGTVGSLTVISARNL